MSNQGVPSTRNPRRLASGAIPVTRPEIHVRVVSSTHIGRVRAANEDSCAIVDLDLGANIAPGTLGRIDLGAKGVLLAVSDGMGGARDGEVASRITIEQLVSELLEAPAAVNPSWLLEHATRAAGTCRTTAAARESPR